VQQRDQLDPLVFFPPSRHHFCGIFYKVGYFVERFFGFIIVGFDIREVGRFGFWRSD
jgi:hypothetical protein